MKKMCAIGCLLNEQDFEIIEKEKLNSKSFCLLPKIISLKQYNNEIFFEKLQDIHDHSFNLEGLKFSFKNFASNYKLDDSKVELITEWVVKPEIIHCTAE